MRPVQSGTYPSLTSYPSSRTRADNTPRRYAGYLATHERYFLALDTLPLFLGIVVYTYFWPGRYLTKETKVVKDDVEVASAASRTEAVGLEVPAGPAMVERSPSRI